ncbi:MAG: glucose-6-phosphate isomerase [Christensenellaceae bacterium]|jgi:glucose-6-phosphate isomerase|nr:glucose-6-phosphate isomerase [Christensenellaceae bacterium]
MDSKLKFDFNNMMAQYVGDKDGYTVQDLEKLDVLAEEVAKSFTATRGKGMTEWAILPEPKGDLVNAIKQTAKEIRNDCDAFVVLGIGGSALGPMALFQALCHLRHNELPRSRRKAPKFYVEDNIDPDRMQALLDVLNLDKTIFNIITKSGSTSETMSQFIIIYDILKKNFGPNAAEHIVATTDAENGSLIEIAKEEGLTTFTIPKGVGGRFSIISPVGLLPAAVLGIDITAFLSGAKHIDNICKRTTSIYQNPALAAAALQYDALVNRGKNISVMMPYSDSLKLMADWYCQLWGESLGKAVNKAGETVNCGQTPVKALGVTDQHSQIQLYVDGPADKVITFIGVEKFRNTITIPGGYDSMPSLSFLSGHSLNELITAELIATEYAITKKGKLNNKIVLSSVTAESLGQLVMFFMLETAYAGEFLKIDAYNQPGVEEGKNATYALLGRPGYEAKAQEIMQAPKKNSRYVLGT